MGKKSSVYFGAPLITLTSNLKSGDSVSGKINRMAERYAVINKSCNIELSDGEQKILVSVINDNFADVLTIRYLAEIVADSEFSKMENGMSLIEKLKLANVAEIIATVEALNL